MSNFKKQRWDVNTLQELTPDQVKGAKEKYGKVWKVTTPSDKVCFLHKPTRQAMDNAEAQSQNKASAFNETLIKECWLAGDKTIVSNDDDFFSVGKQLGKLIKVQAAELEEL